MNAFTINTYTGKHFDLRNPTPEMVDIEDIAHALSLLARFNGHTQNHYSVAQHSLFMSMGARHLDPDVQMWCLLHDAPEAYVGDLPSPLKAYMTDLDEAVSCHEHAHEGIMYVIKRKWGLPECPQVVKDMDRQAAAHEFNSLFSGGRSANDNGFRLEGPSSWPMREIVDWFHEANGQFKGIGHWSAKPHEVEEFFLEEFHRIQARREARREAGPV